MRVARRTAKLTCDVSSLCCGLGVVVSAGLVSRPVEFRAISEFLQSAAERTSGFVIEGEAGIGKTTLWLAAHDEARARGFQVLSARVGETESVLAYAAVADLLGDIDPAILERLPDVQRGAVDRVLLRASSDGAATDQRVVAAAFASVVNRLAADSPVLIAIDDGQWLDRSSQDVVAFAARRFKARVGLLFTERSDADGASAVTWLHLSRPDGIERVRVGPLSLGGLHALISARLDRSFPRPAMVRIAEISGGNPFYALELAHAIDVGAASSEPVLPGTLAELMRLRIGRLDPDARQLLLAAAADANPTVELVARVTGNTVECAVELLEEAKNKGIIVIDGDLVRFAHPLFARSVYTDASPAQRRAVHRSLAAAAILPELKARHMALSASRADPEVLNALDKAAGSARARGAPAAAAEMIDLAIGLGGDTPTRRIRAATNHLQAGNPESARTVLEPSVDQLPAGRLRTTAFNLLAAVQIHDNSFVRAAALLRQALSDVDVNDALYVQTLLLLSFAQLNAGEFGESLRNAEQAVASSDELGVLALRSRVLALWVTVSFMCGRGLDEASLYRALELEDPDDDAPIAFRASANSALLLAYTGSLDKALTQMQAVGRRCVERGAETDMMFVAVFSALIYIWRGEFHNAQLLADEATERAQQLGGDHMRVVAMTVQTAVAAYIGNEGEAREAGQAALDLAQQHGSPRLADWSTISLGFLEVSLGNYVDAMARLQPVVSRFDDVPGTEIITSAYIPDAVEAMVAAGHHADAEPLIAALERNGERLGRSWMLAIGARCRGIWLAAQGDVEAAARKAQDAMAEHDRLPMPFERARTQLLLGQLQRRQRQKESARATLREALQAFDAMGTPLWADRARAELARADVAPTHDLALTPSEQRVAELAASGMTNRNVAAALFISPKTVEANLARIYRKLGISSRAELGRLVADL
ncbi:MAG: transcriptional regulator, luxR family [Mycobacterium sp.]|nr:transcriptional regulator, luxR family [Mycobacterium sp.]